MWSQDYTRRRMAAGAMQHGYAPGSVLLIFIATTIHTRALWCTRSAIRVFWRGVVGSVCILTLQTPFATGQARFTWNVDVAPDLARAAANAGWDSVGSVGPALGTPSSAGHPSRRVGESDVQRLQLRGKMESGDATLKRAQPTKTSAYQPSSLQSCVFCACRSGCPFVLVVFFKTSGRRCCES